ncbi:hypothetical protein A4R27_07485 [Priestia endophytica]|uniref:YjcZ family sporulation protein n=1 Tax=Priestia endophytica TaxID=135735 RepID=A0AAX1Q3I3_9BACI|nr:YjcZ family sporulation protein [Priestia endophytica]RAS72736.1 hypothetical protein A3864_21575 [Priestia endophytica]RAS83174.1 hypothetical protein A4R27_07485 [Priestia endophytica]
MYNNANLPFTSGENAPFSPGISPGYSAPGYGYGCDVHHGRCDNFAIIVVLFILLIIIGACAFSGYKG